MLLSILNAGAVGLPVAIVGTVVVGGVLCGRKTDDAFWAQTAKARRQARSAGRSATAAR
jgi:hypothetical protein